MADRVDVGDDVIRCELGAANRHTTGELLRSLVHHHCARGDLCVELVEALDAALDDLVDTVWPRWGCIDSIEMGPSCQRLDLRLTGPSDQPTGEQHPAGPIGPVAAALFGNVEWTCSSELSVSCDLQREVRP